MSEQVMEEEIGEGIDLDEIAKKYEERGFFKRLGDMFKGLGKPHDTRDYKLARIELQRLAAPLAAIVVPIVFGVVLCVVTMISSQKKDSIVVDIAHQDFLRIGDGEVVGFVVLRFERVVVLPMVEECPDIIVGRLALGVAAIY